MLEANEESRFKNLCSEFYGKIKSQSNIVRYVKGGMDFAKLSMETNVANVGKKIFLWFSRHNKYGGNLFILFI